MDWVDFDKGKVGWVSAFVEVCRAYWSTTSLSARDWEELFGALKILLTTLPNSFESPHASKGSSWRFWFRNPSRTKTGVDGVRGYITSYADIHTNTKGALV